MKTLFILPGPEKWASSRIRAIWVAKHMQDAYTVTADEDFQSDDYDAFILVKTHDINFTRKMIEQGKQVWWDVCDPAWWGSPKESRENADTVTGVVASNKGLAEDFNKWYGKPVANVIPDRLDLSHYPKQRVHQTADPVRFIWFGASQNRFSLLGALIVLERLKANGYNISLTIYDDRPEDAWNVTNTVPTYYARWELHNENEVISSHDIALLPPYPGPWGRCKSNNKVLTAWACGLPVVSGFDYKKLEVMCRSAAYRDNLAFAGMHALKRDYRVEQSAREWEALLCP